MYTYIYLCTYQCKKNTFKVCSCISTCNAYIHIDICLFTSASTYVSVQCKTFLYNVKKIYIIHIYICLFTSASIYVSVHVYLYI